MGVGAEGVDESSRVIVVGEDDGKAPLAEVLGEARRRCSPKMLRTPSCRSVGEAMSLWFAKDVG